MSGDLEDFLRRAAQRRQAKSVQQQQAAEPVRSQYSDRRSERVTSAADAEEPLMAEIVEDDSNSFSARQRRVEEARRAAALVEAQVAKSVKSARGVKAAASTASRSAAVAVTGDVIKDLRQLLSHSHGVKQAILLKEILDRPEHRW